MNCKDQVDCKLAKDVETYYFYCANKGAMVDWNDCRKCEYNQYKS